jgi:hypothetical protein
MNARPDRTEGPRRSPGRGSPWFKIGLTAFAWVAAAGCQTEDKVLYYKPFFTGISGAEFHGAQPVNSQAGYSDPTHVPEQKIVIEKADGTKILIAKTVRHMMTHVERCLDEGDDDLLMEQVISSKTIEQYRAQGKDPQEIIKYLRKNRKDLAKLFSRMPLGEYTPTVILEQPGDKTWVVKLSGKPAEGMKFTRVWARMEEGNWKFLWVN